MDQTPSYDVIVIGAGPGGCATAAIAARAGLRCLLLERSAEPQFKVGESLMPKTYSTLSKMGALERMRASSFPEKHSVQFFPSSGRGSSPFYFADLDPSESSRTWQVLRSEFDQLLLETARDQGADCRRGIAVKEILFDGDQAVGVRVEADGEQHDIGCKVVVDASGQRSLIARQLGLGRHDYDLDHASIFTHYRGAVRDPGLDEGATLILHTTNGDSWFWYIPLQDDVVSVGVVGSVDYLIRREDRNPQATLDAEIQLCPEIARRVEGAEQIRPALVLKDFSYRWAQMAGDGWLLVGDAYSFIDPVYSSGVFLALRSGELAAETIVGAIERGDLSAEALGAYQPEVQKGIEAVYELVRAFYRRDFSFGGFLRRFPHHQRNVTRILVGDVFDTGFDDLFDAMERFGTDNAQTQPLQVEQLQA